jgi:hypothetical protein
MKLTREYIKGLVKESLEEAITHEEYMLNKVKEAFNKKESIKLCTYLSHDRSPRRAETNCHRVKIKEILPDGIKVESFRNRDNPEPVTYFVKNVDIYNVTTKSELSQTRYPKSQPEEIHIPYRGGYDKEDWHREKSESLNENKDMKLTKHYIKDLVKETLNESKKTVASENKISKSTLDRIIKEEHQKLEKEGYGGYRGGRGMSGDQRALKDRGHDDSDIYDAYAVTAGGRKLSVTVGWFLGRNSVDDLIWWQADKVKEMRAKRSQEQEDFGLPKVIVQPEPKEEPKTKLARYPEYARVSQAFFLLRKEGLDPSEILNDPFLKRELAKSSEPFYIADEPDSEQKIPYSEEALKANMDKKVFTSEYRLDR